MEKKRNAVTIANRFIELSSNKGLTLMQLLKLSYIAHGFKLGLSGKPLANETVQAWKFGPVFPSIYHEFKYEPSNSKIKELATDLNKSRNALEPVRGNFTETEEKIISLVYDIYGDINGLKLSALTHKEGTPWYKAWNEEGGERHLWVSYF